MVGLFLLFFFVHTSDSHVRRTLFWSTSTPLTPGIAFSVLALFNILRVPMLILPMAVVRKVPPVQLCHQIETRGLSNHHHIRFFLVLF